jgi:hypothetical protein
MINKYQKSTVIDCYLRLDRPFVHEETMRSNFSEIRNNMLKDLLNSSQEIQLYLYEYGPIPLQISRSEPSQELLKGYEEIAELNFNELGKIFFDCWIRFSIEINLSQSLDNFVHCDGNGNEKIVLIPENEKERWNLDHVISLFKECLCKFIFSVNVARAGFCLFRNGIIAVEGKIPIIPTRLELLQFDQGYSLESHKYALELGWPKVVELPLVEFWNWLNEIEGFKEGFSKCPLGRSVNCLSYTGFTDNRNFSDLIWALMGLEAQYVSGIGKEAQLVTNSQKFLESFNAYNSTNITAHIRQMYNQRSRFLHGDMNLPNRYTADETSDEINEFWVKDYDATLLAIAMLISTIQTMFLKNIRKIEHS